MARDPRTACARVGSFAALALCVLLCSQAPRLLSQDLPQGSGKRTLYLLLRTPPDQSTETDQVILGNITKGINKANLRIRGKPEIRPVSPGFVEEVQKLISGAGWRVEAADAAKIEKNSTIGSTMGQLNIRSLSVSDNIYEIKLPSPKYVLKELSVEFTEGKTKTYRVSPSKDDQLSELEMRYPGSYALRLQGDDVPKKCTAKLLDGKGELILTADWPAQGKAYLLILQDFEGDLNKLFSVVQNPDVVGNPIQLLSLDQHLFAVASVGLETESTSFIRGNTLTVVAPDLKTRRVKHVWVYLPIREEEVDKEIERWLKHESVKNVSRDLPILIEKNLVRLKHTAKINRNSINQPKWWETAREGNDRFIRAFLLEDIPELVDRLPSMWMLSVWIFEDSDGNKELIFIKNRQGKTAPMESQEIITWRQSLPKLKAIKK